MIGQVSIRDAKFNEEVRAHIEPLSKRGRLSGERMIAEKFYSLQDQEHDRKHLYARNQAYTPTADPHACLPEPTGAGPVSTYATT